MAAYAALLALSEATDLRITQHKPLFSSDDAEKIMYIHNSANSLLWQFKNFPEKVNHLQDRIRDVAHEIAATIQIWQRNQKVNHLPKRMRVMNPPRLELEKELHNLVEIEGELRRELPSLPPSLSSSSSSRDGNGGVIGLEADLMEVKKRLYGDSHLEVIPITGMGGVGKTTLARALYNDKFINSHFDICAWAVVSQDYNLHTFRRKLLHSMKLFEKLVFGDYTNESDIELKVHQTLSYRRYLVVIDDVWGINVWDDIQAMFPDNNNGSRIMLTTRQLDVAVYPLCSSTPYVMRLMKDSQSWELLKQKVFTNGNCPPELEDVGKDIARRCAGLPLAIVLAAGVLSVANMSRASWEEIASRVSWEEIAKNEFRDVRLELEEIMSLSYTCLPHHLRSCFLFIGGFQKDGAIRTSRLIRLWATEGFQEMEATSRKSLEEKGEEYLEDLVKRNLVVVTSKKSDGKIKTCSLHDMIHGLCIRKAQQEKFLRIIDVSDLSQVLIDEPRISFSHSNVGNFEARILHTILCFQIQKFPSWVASLENYKLLAKLDVLGVELKEFPSQVLELYHLKYLALKGSFIIPSDISNLLHLQTLIIHLPSGKLRGRCTGVVTHSLPLEIWSLPQLRHLFFHAPYMLPHPLQGSDLPLQYLQTLLLVADLVWNEQILQSILNVKRLGLTYTSNKEHHLHLLKHLDHLEKLEVIGYPGFSWRGQNPSFPPTLKKLTLVGGGFPWSDMAIVGSLPYLQVLKLLDNACDGETWETATGAFPSLMVLLIGESNLLEWKVETDSFPKLRRLVLRSCWILIEIPHDIGEIPTLELIEVDYYCTKSLLESAKEIKKDQEADGNDTLQVHFGGKEQMYKFQPGVVEDGDEDEVETTSEIMEVDEKDEDAVGLEEGVEKVLRVAISNEEQGLWISLVRGVSGSGKTTLARKIYDHADIVSQFECRAWVCVASDSTNKEVLMELIKSQVTGSNELQRDSLFKEMEQADNESLQQMLLQHLQGKRYFIVLDGVHELMNVKSILKGLPHEERGSRLLITSTSGNIRIPIHYYHVMKTLGSDRAGNCF